MLVNNLTIILHKIYFYFKRSLRPFLIPYKRPLWKEQQKEVVQGNRTVSDRKDGVTPLIRL